MGITPTEPGFDKFQINVRPGQLKHLRTKTPSVKGTISVDYDNENDATSLQCHVPMGSKADVKLPQNVAKVTVNNKTQEITNHTISLTNGDWTLRY